MGAFEHLVWEKFGQQFCHAKDRMKVGISSFKVQNVISILYYVCTVVSTYHGLFRMLPGSIVIGIQQGNIATITAMLIWKEIMHLRFVLLFSFFV